MQNARAHKPSTNGDQFRKSQLELLKELHSSSLGYLLEMHVCNKRYSKLVKLYLDSPPQVNQMSAFSLPTCIVSYYFVFAFGDSLKDSSARNSICALCCDKLRYFSENLPLMRRLVRLFDVVIEHVTQVTYTIAASNPFPGRHDVREQASADKWQY